MSTASVLDLMAQSVVNRKVQAGAKLTPVGMEAATITAAAPLPRTPAAFPNDVPDEALLQRVAILEELFARIAGLDEQQEELRRQVHAQYAGIREAMDAVKGVLTPAPAVTAPTADAVKAKERAADERVAAIQSEVRDAIQAVEDEVAGPDTAAEMAAKAVLAHMDQKAAEAQAATFAPPSGAAVALAEDMIEGWFCPDHLHFATKTSRLGREYRACPTEGCKQFEKLA